MKRFIIFSFLGIFFFGCVLSLGVTYWLQHPQKNEQVILIVEKGASLSQILLELAEKKIVDFPLILKAILYPMGMGRNLKAGEYLIPSGITPLQLVHILQSGKIMYHCVTLIEGETSHHFREKLLKDSRFHGTCEIPAEGSLLPETYEFPRGTERQKIIERLQKAMDKALAKLWAQRLPDTYLKSSTDLVVLASIIEKETARRQEKPIVSAVFHNRLKKSIPLQADPTIFYAITKGEHILKRDLTGQDLQLQSPYNTYLHEGLPPTPIANPSLASLKAALHPASVPYLYFVADGSGGHVFSSTLRQHQKNHKAWRKLRAGK